MSKIDDAADKAKTATDKAAAATKKAAKTTGENGRRLTGCAWRFILEKLDASSRSGEPSRTRCYNDSNRACGTAS